MSAANNLFSSLLSSNTNNNNNNNNNNNAVMFGPQSAAAAASAPVTADTSLFVVSQRYAAAMLPAPSSSSSVASASAPASSSPDGADAMKVLLVDAGTLAMLSMGFTQSQLLQRGVFLVHNLLHAQRRQRRPLKNMACVIYIRPELPSVEAACRELEMGCYGSYHVVFSGAASPAMLERLAVADQMPNSATGRAGLVTRVEEVFADFCAVNRDAFLLETAPPAALLSGAVANSQVRRVAEGLAAMMVARRQRPFIRFQRGSAYATRVARELQQILSGDPELYDYRAGGQEAVLLILDRSDDPLTPLLTPWTYQAMLHEHIGLSRNTLRLPEEARAGGQDSNDDDEEYVFSQNDDVFFAANLFSNWGEICDSVKRYVDKCKAALQLDRSTATMEDLKEFMHKIPQTKSLTGSVTKHATVTSHLSQVIKRRSLLEVSLLEQDMVAASDPQGHFERFQKITRTNGIDGRDVLRLALIYYLRYEAGAGAAQQQQQQQSASSVVSRTAPYLEGLGSSSTQLLRRLRDYYDSGVSSSSSSAPSSTSRRDTARLFASTGLVSRIVRTFSADVGNIYTQHEPVLQRTLRELLCGELDPAAYPFLTPPAPPRANCPDGCFKPRSVTVFMCGGYTFEEAALVNAVNEGKTYAPGAPGSGGGAQAEFLDGGRGVHVVLGGERALNSAQFVEMLGQLP